MPQLAYNKRATFEYEILEKFQVGLALSGKMVKQLRSNRVNLLGKFIIWQREQLQIIGLGNEEVSENINLLATKKEIGKIREAISVKGISCIPISIFTSKRWIKAEIALVKGKKNWDKREDIKKRDLDRDQQREKL